MYSVLIYQISTWSDYIDMTSWPLHNLAFNLIHDAECSFIHCQCHCFRSPRLMFAHNKGGRYFYIVIMQCHSRREVGMQNTYKQNLNMFEWFKNTLWHHQYHIHECFISIGKIFIHKIFPYDARRKSNVYDFIFFCLY